MELAGGDVVAIDGNSNRRGWRHGGGTRAIPLFGLGCFQGSSDFDFPYRWLK